MKRCYFFGAGAEKSFGLSDGGDFAKAVLGLENPILDNAIEDYYKNVNNNYSSWYSKYPGIKKTSLSKETIYKSTIKKKHLESEIEFDNESKYNNAIENEFNSLTEEQREKMFSENPSYIDLIDGYFHTLIAPKYFGPYKFWKVVSCYTRAYLYLVGKIIYGSKNISKEEYLDILKNPHNTMDDILKKCSNNKNDKNYYKTLSKHEKDNEIRVITTNYTPFCRCILNKENNKPNENIAYLNGRFGLFESARELRVYDVEEDELPKNEVLFPYIFIQSGVKPIIDIKQLQEYKKAIEFLDESDELIILGYRMNSDDNHINSLIRSYLLQDKKITFFKHSKQSDISNYNDYEDKKYILKKLRIFEDDKDFSYISNLKCVPFNDKNCVDIFEEYLEKNNK